jgi:hypothetical protein
MTPLNIATTLRYLACGDKHTPGDDFVERDYNGHNMAMPICSVCEVPIPPRYPARSFRIGPGSKKWAA